MHEPPGPPQDHGEGLEVPTISGSGPIRHPRKGHSYRPGRSAYRGAYASDAHQSPVEPRQRDTRPVGHKPPQTCRIARPVGSRAKGATFAPLAGPVCPCSPLLPGVPAPRARAPGVCLARDNLELAQGHQVRRRAHAGPEPCCSPRLRAPHRPGAGIPLRHRSPIAPHPASSHHSRNAPHALPRPGSRAQCG